MRYQNNKFPILLTFTSHCPWNDATRSGAGTGLLSTRSRNIKLGELWPRARIHSWPAVRSSGKGTRDDLASMKRIYWSQRPGNIPGVTPVPNAPGTEGTLGRDALSRMRLSALPMVPRRGAWRLVWKVLYDWPRRERVPPCGPVMLTESRGWGEGRARARCFFYLTFLGRCVYTAEPRGEGYKDDAARGL